MVFKIVLNLFVKHPLAAIICLLIGGGIIFGMIGGLTNIPFFIDNWIWLIAGGFFILIIWILLLVMIG